MTYARTALVALACGSFASGTASAQDDAEALFQQNCAQCHAIDEEINQIGPHLVDVVGREAGGLEDFAYSDAMAESEIVWDAETLDEFIADPQAVIPDNNMPFPGIEDEGERAAIVSLLEEASGDGGQDGE